MGDHYFDRNGAHRGIAGCPHNSNSSTILFRILEVELFFSNYFILPLLKAPALTVVEYHLVQIHTLIQVDASCDNGLCVGAPIRRRWAVAQPVKLFEPITFGDPYATGNLH